jgi:protein-tyrosine phosphatase
MKRRQKDYESLWSGEYNEITENLWIGDIDSVRERSTSQFDTVVTVCQDSVKDNISCNYAQFKIADGPQTAEKYGGSHEYSLFEDATHMVLRNLELEKKVLTHCHNGQSRSAAVCIAALAVHHDTSYSTAYRMVEDARYIVSPDELLEQHAKEYIANYR